MVSALIVMAAAALQQPSCDALRSVSLPGMTITAVELVPAGAQVPGRGRGGGGDPLPAHCRVAATLAPSDDSEIRIPPVEPERVAGRAAARDVRTTRATRAGARRSPSVTPRSSSTSATLASPASLVPPEGRTLLADAVVRACDPRDGVTDGIIGEPRACRFDPAALACTEGARSTSPGAGASCLTAPQVEAARSAYAPVTTSDGALVYPGHSPGFESGWRVPVAGQPLGALWADMVRYVGRQDPDWDPATFDLDMDLALAVGNAGVIEARDPDLAAFRARGGKLLLYHGWADPGPAPENTIDYHEAVQAALGGEQGDWMRTFLMPGVGHCGGGVGPDQADFLGAMERWREQGVAPDRIIATRPAGRGRPAPPLSRPLCPFPQVARFSGSGSTNDAASFACVAP